MDRHEQKRDVLLVDQPTRAEPRSRLSPPLDRSAALTSERNAMMHAVWDRSFSAGHDCGTRVAASMARLSALELIEHARWWNRWKRRLMARALLACAEDLESAADAGGDRVMVVDRVTIESAHRLPTPLRRWSSMQQRARTRS